MKVLLQQYHAMHIRIQYNHKHACYFHHQVAIAHFTFSINCNHRHHHGDDHGLIVIQRIDLNMEKLPPKTVSHVN